MRTCATSTGPSDLMGYSRILERVGTRGIRLTMLSRRTNATWPCEKRCVPCGAPGPNRDKYEPLTLHQAIFLAFAGAVGGAMNAVAGGGSFISFPALMFSGVPAVPANATSTIALLFGVSASGGAYRDRLSISRRVMVPLILISLVGGFIGAILLVRTPTQTFLRIIPWLLLAATLLFAFGKRLTDIFAGGISGDASNLAIAGASLFELIVAIYGGYFGGGIGIMNLAMLAALGMTDIHAMNALKVLLSGTANGVATVTFLFKRVIFWPQAIVMTAGALVGGYFSAHYAQKLPPAAIRWFILVVGFGMTIYFFVRAYR